MIVTIVTSFHSNHRCPNLTLTLTSNISGKLTYAVVNAPFLKGNEIGSVAENI